MAIYTPRGLKIRLPIDYSFALMARLYPSVDAFRILKTTEGIESVPQFLVFTTAVVCFLNRISPMGTGILVFTAHFAGYFLMQRGLFLVPGLVGAGTLYSYLSGYGLFITSTIIVGFLTTGWRGLAAYGLARLMGFIVNFLSEGIQARRTFRQTGLAVTASEVHFINAYRLHASRLGLSTDVSVSQWELDEANWGVVFSDLAVTWPEVVSRFTRD